MKDKDIKLLKIEHKLYLIFKKKKIEKKSKKR